MSDLYSTMSRKSISDLLCSVALPAAYVMDCGCWLRDSRTFGVVSGNVAAIGTMATTQRQEHRQTIAASKKIFSLFAEKLSVSSAPPGSPKEWYLNVHDAVAASCDSGASDATSFFCSPDQMYLIIPDTHICLGDVDACDFFYDKDGRNGHILAALLQLCRGSKYKAITVQSGDMFDVWMAESHVINMYTSRPGEGKKIIRTAKSDIERVTASVHNILNPIRYQSRDDGDALEQILSHLDHYITGNHDAAVTKFAKSTEEIRSYLRKRGVQIHDGVKLWRPGADGHFGIEHGHRHDKENDTTATYSEATEYASVSGKAPTMAFAQGLREKATSKTGLDQGTLLPKGVEVEYEPPKNASSAGSGGNWKTIDGAITSVTGFGSEIFGASFVDHLSVITNNSLNGFGAMRRHLLESLCVQIRQSNQREGRSPRIRLWPFTQYQGDTGPNGSVADDFSTRMRIAIWEEQGVSKAPSISPRLIVHSHTHTPMLTRLNLVHRYR